MEEGVAEGGGDDEEYLDEGECESSESDVFKSCCGGEEPAQKHQNDQGMEAAEKVGKSEFSVFG